MSEDAVQRYLVEHDDSPDEREWMLRNLALWKCDRLTPAMSAETERIEGFPFCTSTDIIRTIMKQTGMSYEAAWSHFGDHEPQRFFCVEDYSSAIAAMGADRRADRGDDGVPYGPNRIFLYDPRDVDAWLAEYLPA